MAIQLTFQNSTRNMLLYALDGHLHWNVDGNLYSYTGALDVNSYWCIDNDLHCYGNLH